MKDRLIALNKHSGLKIARQLLQLLLIMVCFLFSVRVIGSAFGQLGEEMIHAIIDATSNPFVSLFIGIILTAMIQSSSTSTSMTVAFVASGVIGLEQAVPLIMGANIGTTITSLIVALGFINRKRTFRKAIAVGTLHSLYNVFLVLILFPLEMQFGLLSSMAQNISQKVLSFPVPSIGNIFIFKGSFFSKLSEMISSIGNGYFLLLVGITLLVLSLKMITKISRNALIGSSGREWFDGMFQRSEKSFGWGIFFTMALQSSSVTTSILVPLVATEKIQVKNAFPFIIGANLGTTITALLAAFFGIQQAMPIAIVHLLFNVTGVLLFMPLGGIRQLLVNFSGIAGRFAMKYRLSVFVYIFVIFFALPFALIYFNHSKEEVSSSKMISKPSIFKVEKTTKPPQIIS
ncbi:Na/Pi symporter [Xanthovirga aplysinae]|uniref:Na/Pi symporter n=1 Tax=Xanthovirga aplysinae TaxID=2529853 RepID=UPI0012BD0D84|nr:Na/Pi symporter [Xanthovirga aplysinae]MTI32647.1 Na/Pi cotransporter family protein [Xanthovirga aplysinae]